MTTTSNAPDGTTCNEEESKSSIHVAVQAYDYEIERSHSVLPARRRLIPFKFRYMTGICPIWPQPTVKQMVVDKLCSFIANKFIISIL